MKAGGRKLEINVPVNESQDGKQQQFSLTNTGTFKEGDLAINKKGLQIKGESPTTTPSGGPRVGLDMALSFSLADLQVIKLLGAGAGGSVQKALHVPSKRIVALKVIPLDVKESVRKQIILELKTLYRNQSEYIVFLYDAFYTDGSILIGLEYMDGGSLADLLKASGKIEERVLANITTQVLKDLWSLGLTLVECALGYYPYSTEKEGKPVSFFELLDFIVVAPAPELPSTFSPELRSFIGECLQKAPEERPSASELLNHPFIKKYQDDDLDMAEWVQSLVE